MPATGDSEPPAPPPDPDAPGVRFTRDVRLPSFGGWLQGMGFQHDGLTARQIDAMLGLFLASHLN